MNERTNKLSYRCSSQLKTAASTLKHVQRIDYLCLIDDFSNSSQVYKHSLDTECKDFETLNLGHYNGNCLSSVGFCK